MATAQTKELSVKWELKAPWQPQRIHVIMVKNEIFYLDYAVGQKFALTPQQAIDVMRAAGYSSGWGWDEKYRPGGPVVTDEPTEWEPPLHHENYKQSRAEYEAWHQGFKQGFRDYLTKSSLLTLMVMHESDSESHWEGYREV